MKKLWLIGAGVGFLLLTPRPVEALAGCCRCALMIDPDTWEYTLGCLCSFSSGALSCTIHAGGGCTTNGVCSH